MTTEVIEGIPRRTNRVSALDVRVLLVSANAGTIQLFDHALQEFHISPDVCQEMSVALRLLNRQKFDAVIVDLELGKEAGLILEQVHLSLSNRRAVTFGINAGDAEASACRRESEFVFQRPLSAQSIHRTLKSAYGMILREQRRYFRCPISIPVSIVRRNMEEVRSQSVNISEGGMSVSTFVALEAGEDVHVNFTLPNYNILVEAESKVCWLKMGRIGIRFVSLSANRISQLQDWLSRKLEESLPEVVAREFQLGAYIHNPTSPIVK